LLGDKRLPQTTATSSPLIGIMHLRKRCHSQRHRTRLADIACPLADIATASPEDSVAGILPRLTDCADRRALVFSDGHLAGIIPPSDITRMIDRLGLLRSP
jgi:CBS-domain-containing membrane protein